MRENVFVPIKSEFKEDIKTTYYDISGLSSEDLNAQMQTFGPEYNSQERVAGMANCALDWTYPLFKDGACLEVEVIVSCQVTLPRWANYSEATFEMQQKWDTYYAALEEHELTHVQFAKDAGKNFLEEIKNIKDYKTCQEFDDKIYPIQEKYLVELQKKHDEFDSEPRPWLRSLN